MSDETAIEAPEEETPERPEWLPENFKTPEDLAKSYAEAERKITELAAKAKEAETLAEQNRQWQEYAREQQAAQQQPTGDPRDRFLEVWEDPDRQADLVLHLASTVADLQAQVAQASQTAPDPALTEISARLAQDQMAAQFPDWDHYAEKVSEAVAANPRLLGLTEESRLSDLTRGLESVYYMVRGQASLTPEGQAAHDAAEAARLAKQQALTQSGSSTRPATLSDDDQYAQRIMDAARNSGGYGS